VLHLDASHLAEKVLDALIGTAPSVCSLLALVFLVIRYRPPVPVLSRTLGKRLRTTSTVADFRIFSSRANNWH
jgi:hypothetical protein